jgi:RNA polymerase sigma factor (TIGR02999 family)
MRTALASEGSPPGQDGAAGPGPAAAGEVTALLGRLREGDRAALDRVVATLYDELRQLARRRLRREWGTRALRTTELVHETYLRLLAQRRLAVADRAELFAIAATIMRRVLVDVARTRQRQKRGRGRADVPLEEAAWFASDREAEEMLLLDQALGAWGRSTLAPRRW